MAIRLRAAHSRCALARSKPRERILRCTVSLDSLLELFNLLDILSIAESQRNAFSTLQDGLLALLCQLQNTPCSYCRSAVAVFCSPRVVFTVCSVSRQAPSCLPSNRIVLSHRPIVDKP